jgi:2-hydroxy-3-keto-5-methylthiopentenyl-1-phosphate phosphatase
MEDFQLKLLTKRSYEELNIEEKNLMNDWCSSEEEFQGLKSLFSVVESSRTEVYEDVTTKKRLEELFQSKYKTSNGFDWLAFLFPSGVIFFRQPAFQMVFGIVLVIGVSLFFVYQSPVQLAKNEVRKSQTKKSQSEIIKSKEEKTESTVSKAEPNTRMNDRIVNNYNCDDIAPALVSEEKFVKLEQEIVDFEGELGAFSADYSLAEEDKDFLATPIQPVSSNPSVLDLLFQCKRCNQENSLKPWREQE